MDWGMIGHEGAVDLLAGHVAQRRERHAYLITGPQGVGKKTLALRFAEALNCTKPPAPGQQCQQCSTCKRIEGMQHPDLSVVEAEHEGEVLRIDQVRELQHKLSVAPYEARYRVALLLRFEEAHTNAANAMLKTLEEPPPQVVVILTAKSVESLLPTIVSRCEVLKLRPLSVDETSKGMQVIKGVPAEIAEVLASSRGDRFAFAKQRVDNKEELRNELQVWLTFWRDALIFAAGLTDPITNLDYSARIQKLADKIGLHNAHFHVENVESTLDRIDRNVNPRLALEFLL